MLTIAIGDIHGCYGKLVDLLDQCRAFAGGRSHRFIFIGDYIDRGPHSRAVIELLLELERTCPIAPVFLMGNHEDMIVSAMNDAAAKRHWLANGGGATLESYLNTGGLDLLAAHVAWLAARPLSFDDGERFYVHAGIDPARPIGAQTRDDLLWIRNPFLYFEGDLGRLVVHGHTPTMDGRPDVRPNRINIDTGAVFGGPLTAAVFSAEQREPIAFLQSQL
jgi:serine/threonine protein phosphatase 1